MSDFSYAPSRPTGQTIVRPTTAVADRLLRFRWPSERHLTPKNCSQCGARLIANDPPTASFPVTDVTCLLCGEAVCELVADGWRRPITAAEFKALPAQQGRRPVKGEMPAHERLVQILGHGQPMPRRELADALNVSASSIPQTVVRARAAGADVVGVDGVYQMRGRI